MPSKSHITIESFPLSLLGAIEKSGKHGYKIIEDFVRNRRVEDAYLDFKQKKDPKGPIPDIDDKRALAKAISGFAHADSGVLVWGVDARRPGNDSERADVACDLKPIENVEAFVSHLNDLSVAATTPAVPGLRNVPIVRSAGRGYAITYVPVGSSPPYRATWHQGDNYYKRTGRGFYPMQPFDLRDVILRVPYPKLRFDAEWESRHGDSAVSIGYYWLKGKITNVGQQAVNDWKLVLEFSSAIADPTDAQDNWTPRSEFFIRDNCQWRRLVIQTTVLHPQARPAATIFPDETVVVIGNGSVVRAAAGFVLTKEARDQGGREVNWFLFSDRGPASHGSLALVR